MDKKETDVEFKGEILEWTIENYSAWSHELHGTRLESPKIFLFSNSSGLELFPKGLNGRENHSIVRVFEVWIGVSSECELSIVGSNGSTLYKDSLPIPSWDEKLHPTYKYVEVVIPNTWSEDTLTLRLRLKSFSNAFHRVRTVIEVFDRTIKVPPAVFENFSARNEEFVSKSHCTFNGTTQMIIIEASKDRLSGKGVFKLESIPMPNNMIVRSIMDIFIDNAHSETKEGKYVFDGRLTISLGLFVNAIRKKRISVVWRLQIVPGSTRETIDFSHSLGEGVRLAAGHPVKTAEDDSIRIDKAVLDLTKDLMSLYQNQDMPDFTLRCGHASFPAHKSILCARSPVFKAMLGCGMAEGLNGEVDVEDMDETTLQAFLLFLYTGRVGDDAQSETIQNLYYAADKYQVPSLKRECSAVLGSNVSVSNVCDVLMLGDRHADDGLVSVAREFILENYQAVLRSKEWEVLMKSDPVLACQTVTQFARESCVGKIKPREYYAHS